MRPKGSLGPTRLDLSSKLGVIGAENCIRDLTKIKISGKDREAFETQRKWDKYGLNTKMS
jgi:hypothetical protein